MPMSNLGETFEIMNVGKRVVCTTFLEVIHESQKPPYTMGNLFALVNPKTQKPMWVRNMFLENFEAVDNSFLSARGNIEVLAFPESDSCFIIDSRVPRNWLNTH